MNNETFKSLFEDVVQANCHSCKYSKPLSNMLGCEKHKKIILEPKRRCAEWILK